VNIRISKGLILAVVMISVCLSHGAEEKYSVDEALRVFRLIEKVQSEQVSKSASDIRTVIVGESEFNSYIAYRIETENEELMKELHLKFLPDDRLEGKIYVDLRGQDIPKFLRPEMNLYLGGKLEVEAKRVRVVLKELFLEGHPVQPKLLDLIIYVTSKIQNTEPSSIYDWYELPFGIKNIRIEKGRAIFFY